MLHQTDNGITSVEGLELWVPTKALVLSAMFGFLQEYINM